MIVINTKLRFLQCLFLLIFSIAVSCAEEKESEKAFDIVFEKSQTIAIDGLFVNNYNEGCCLTVVHGKFLVGYNAPRKTLDVFDLERMTSMYQYTLENQGPDAIGKPLRLFMTDISEVFIITKNELIKAKSSPNKSLSVESRFDLNDYGQNKISNFDYDNFQLVVKNTFGIGVGLENTMAYDSVGDRVFLPKYSVIQNDFEPEYFENTLGGWLDLNTGMFTDSNIPYSDYLKKNGLNIPYLYDIQNLWNGKELVYSFAASPSLFVYNSSSESISEKVLPTDALASVVAKPLESFEGVKFGNVKSTMKGMAYGINAVQHFQPVWDPYRKLYYRVSKIKDTKGNESFLVKRYGNHVLTVYNEDFQMVGEAPLPEDFDVTVLVTKEKLLVPLKSNDIEDELRFGLIILNGLKK